jgi:molecular chaperone GrpE
MSETKDEALKDEKVTEVLEKDSVDEKDDKKSVKEDKKTKKTHVEVENEKLKARVAELEQKVKSDAEEYLKARADLDNIRKRLIEQSKEDRKYASQSLINDLITPLDMLSKVINMTQNPTPEVQNFLFGFKMISDQINDILSRDGVKEIKALNEEFDPKFMQAMSKEKVDGVKPGQVIEVLQTGYMYKEHLLRPAMVKVSE